MSTWYTGLQEKSHIAVADLEWGSGGWITVIVCILIKHICREQKYSCKTKTNSNHERSAYQGW